MTSTGWDIGRVYFNDTLNLNVINGSDSESALLKRAGEFFEHFRIENQFIYREQLRQNLSLKDSHIKVQIGDIHAFDENLATQLLRRPSEIVAILENAAKLLARRIFQTGSGDAPIFENLDDLQIQLVSSTSPIAIRELDSQHVGRLVRLSGIVVSASAVSARPSKICIICRGCREERYLYIANNLGPITLPRYCTNSSSTPERPHSPCPQDPYVLVSERSHCVDQQVLKLQEAPEDVPVGELPRTVLMVADRALVNKLSPGTRAVITGIYSIGQNGGTKNSKSPGDVALRAPVIRLLGCQIYAGGYVGSLTEGSNLHAMSETFSERIPSNTSVSPYYGHFSGLAEHEMIAFSRQENLYERFSRSIAPSIYGNEDVKRAICCLLFGGSRKILPDHIRLRGDINILLLGDPGVAKSQFLKFVEKVAPIAVYTSGKGSSAAGLTASVVRDPSSGEFYLEGGAMVLADGGVVCIDEFDKMDSEDRVAIHEAMEQQTISIAKAGITTILNSRTSVLAAANPVFGRYDDLKTPGENIDFSSTILSRFDMIFLLKDEHNAQKDITLARHVLSVHMDDKNQTGNLNSSAGEDFDLATMKRYITFCKSQCAPRLDADASAKLADYYINIRSRVFRSGESDGRRESRNTIPITVRQLEAIVRIAEALAKITLSPVATVEHVEEALRLFQVSTVQAVLAGHSVEGMPNPEEAKEASRIEKTIYQRLPVGSTIYYGKLIQDLSRKHSYPEHLIVRVIDSLVQEEKLIFRAQRKILIRQH